MLKKGETNNPNWERDLSPTMWKKGQSGNPAGPKKGTRRVKTVIRDWLNMTENVRNPITGQIEPLTQLEIIVIAQMRKAREGNVASFMALMDRLEGKPLQTTLQETTQRIVARIFDPEKDNIEDIQEEPDDDDENDAGDEPVIPIDAHQKK